MIVHVFGSNTTLSTFVPTLVWTRGAQLGHASVNNLYLQPKPYRGRLLLQLRCQQAKPSQVPGKASIPRGHGQVIKVTYSSKVHPLCACAVGFIVEMTHRGYPGNAHAWVCPERSSCLPFFIFSTGMVRPAIRKQEKSQDGFLILKTLGVLQILRTG